MATAAVAAGRYYRSTRGRPRKSDAWRCCGRFAGAGIGRELLDALVGDARARGFARVALNAQDHAVGFYAKAGFTPFGATLVECDILHQPMELVL